MLSLMNWLRRIPEYAHLDGLSNPYPRTSFTCSLNSAWLSAVPISLGSAIFPACAW